jgi:hypothetical protein
MTLKHAQLLAIENLAEIRTIWLLLEGVAQVAQSNGR